MNIHTNDIDARPIRATSGAHFACVSLNQWMALTPTELLRAPPEPRPADNSRTAQGQTFRRCVSAAVSKAPAATGVAGKNDRGPQYGKRGGTRDPDYRSFAGRRSPDLI
jgi:hypothetical protein